MARRLSGEGVAKAILNRSCLGIWFEFTTLTPTVPVPRPATWAGGETLAPVKPATRGLGRASTTFLGRMSPPRSDCETAMAFSEG